MRSSRRRGLLPVAVRRRHGRWRAWRQQACRPRRRCARRSSGPERRRVPARVVRPVPGAPAARLLDTGCSGSPTTGTSRTASAIWSIGSSSRDDRGWMLVTYVLPAGRRSGATLSRSIVEQRRSVADADRPAAGEPRAGPSVHAAVPQGPGHWHRAIVVLLVVAAFRNWRLSLFALLPTVIGLIWTAGILALAGIELDLFAMFAVVTFLGIGVDYGIHLVHRYQRARRRRAGDGRAGAGHSRCRCDHPARLRHADQVVVSAAALDRRRLGRQRAWRWPRRRLLRAAGPACRRRRDMTMRVAAVIPAFNEAGCHCQRRRRRPAVVDRVIVVDDGSADETAIGRGRRARRCCGTRRNAWKGHARPHGPGARDGRPVHARAAARRRHAAPAARGRRV